MGNETLQLTVLLFNRGDWWHGQCLERNICSQARTEEEAFKEVRRMAKVHLEASAKEGLGRNLNHLKVAPKFYWDEYKSGGKLLKNVKKKLLSIRQSAMSPARPIPRRKQNVSVIPAAV